MIAVRVPQPHEYQTALRMLYRRSSPPEQQARIDEALAAFGRGELSPHGLLLAEEDGQPAGALLSALQPDKTAFVWPPATIDGPAAGAVADALLGELRSRLDLAGAWLGQCLLEVEDASGREVMERNGFPHLTDLCYLERTSRPPLPAGPAVGFESVTYEPSKNRERFTHVLNETYLGTLDCPELNGLRTAGAALDGHRCSGEFDPARWKIYIADGADVGVLLLNDHPAQNAWEIVYLGISQRHRGRGYGLGMILQGCREAFAAGRAAVLVAVDGRNVYARKIYRAAGFNEIGVKSVHARIGGNSAAPQRGGDRHA